MDVNSVSIALERVRPSLFKYLCDEGIIAGERVTEKDSFLCPNPNHEDTSPSAKILPGGKKGYCHGCERTFDVLQLNHWLKEVPISGFGFIVNNLAPLCEKYEVDFELGDLSEADRFKLDSIRAYRLVADYIVEQLWSDELKEYVEARGLDIEFCRSIGIGVVANYRSMYAMLRENFTAVFLRDIGFEKQAMFSPSSVIFTIRDHTGMPVGFISRDTKHEEKKEAWESAGRRGAPPRKYDASPEKSRIFFKRQLLFGLSQAKFENELDPLYVFEGQFDWAIAHKNGVKNCVALGGTSFTPDYLSVMRRQGIERIVLALDGDTTGEATLKKLLLGTKDEPGMLTSCSFLRVGVLKLPEGYDPHAFILEKGVDAFKELEVEDSFEWALHQQDPQTDQLSACEYMLPFVLTEMNHLRREQMVNMLSDATGISPTAINDEVHRREDQNSAVIEREKEQIAEEALRELKYGESASSHILRAAAERMDALDEIHNVDLLSIDETITALDEQMEKEFMLEGPQGFTYGKLTHLQEDLNGEMAGTVLAIGGVPNTGKCRRFDDKILQTDGSFKTIEDIYKEQSGSVITMDSAFSLGLGYISQYYDSGVIPTLDFVLDCGLEDHSSFNHPYYTPQGWKKASELVVGDYVAIVKQHRCFDKLRSPLNKNEIIILSSLLAEGGLTGSAVKFTNQDNDLRLMFEQACLEEWPGVSFRYEGQNDITICVVDKDRIDNRVIDFCRKHNIWGHKATEKQIPQDIFRCSKEDLALFLSVFFSCDGWVHERSDGRGFEVSISLANQEMITQLRHLLLRFGLSTKIKHSTSSYTGSNQRFDRWTIALRDYDSVNSFNAQIGFALAEKTKKLELLLENFESSRGYYQSYPVWDQLEAAIAKAGVSFTEACRKAFGEKRIWTENRWKTVSVYRPKKDQSLSRHALRELAFALEDQDLINLVDGDIVFDQIVSIEDGGLQQCYDLTVPDTHNFVANDIVVHNTAIQSQLAKELVEFNDDTIVVVQTIDDTRPQFNRRFAVQWAQEYAEKEGLLLANNITLNKIANPKFWQASYPTENQGLDACREFGYSQLRKYLKEGRLYIKDTTHGATLVFLERLVKKAIKDNPGMKVVVILDNFHKAQDFANLDERSAVKRKSQFLKTSIAQGFGVTVFSTFEYKKVETGRRPTNNDLRDAVNIEYDINYLINLFSPLKAAQDTGKEDDCELWHGSPYNKSPIIEGDIGKNKINNNKGRKHFKFYPAQSRYECLSEDEVATIGAYNRGLKATEEGYEGDFVWKKGKRVPILRPEVPVSAEDEVPF